MRRASDQATQAATAPRSRNSRRDGTRTHSGQEDVGVRGGGSPSMTANKQISQRLRVMVAGADCGGAAAAGRDGEWRGGAPSRSPHKEGGSAYRGGPLPGSRDQISPRC